MNRSLKNDRHICDSFLQVLFGLWYDGCSGLWEKVMNVKMVYKRGAKRWLVKGEGREGKGRE